MIIIIIIYDFHNKIVNSKIKGKTYLFIFINLFNNHSLHTHIYIQESNKNYY